MAELKISLRHVERRVIETKEVFSLELDETEVALLAGIGWRHSLPQSQLNKTLQPLIKHCLNKKIDMTHFTDLEGRDIVLKEKTQ